VDSVCPPERWEQRVHAFTAKVRKQAKTRGDGVREGPKGLKKARYPAQLNGEKRRSRGDNASGKRVNGGTLGIEKEIC